MLNNKEQMRKWRNLEYNNSSKNQNPGEKQGYFGWTYHTREREFLCRIEMWAFLWAKEKNSRIKVWRYEKYEGWLMEPAPRRNMLQFAFHWDKKQWDKVVEKEVRSVMGGLLVLQGFGIKVTFYPWFFESRKLFESSWNCVESPLRVRW